MRCVSTVEVAWSFEREADRGQHGSSSRVVKDHFARHPPWAFLLQGEFVEGGGLECGYEDGDQLENQGHHQWVCESRVGTTGPPRLLVFRNHLGS